MSNSFQNSVRRDLQRVGIGKWAILSGEARYLYTVLNRDEQIHAAVIGRTPEGAAMLVATNQRIIYFRRNPFTSTVDDITYEVVSGFILNQAMTWFATITLRTRMDDYTISNVNLKSARIFKKYIEQNRLSGEAYFSQPSATTAGFGMSHETNLSGNVITKEATDFLSSHNIGVISTLSREGSLSSAAVYYTFNKDTQFLNILTKNQTTKAKNITANENVAFTIFDEITRQTVQLRAAAAKEPDATIRQRTYEKIAKPQSAGKSDNQPPVTTIDEGSFTVLRLTPSAFEYHDYKAKK